MVLAVCNTTLMTLGEAQVNLERPLFGTYWTFHRLGLWIAAGFAALATGIAMILIFLHATHYSRPNEQRNIIRILLMIPIYATISFLSFRFYKHAIYWEVIRDCYEALAIASFFHLLCFYLEPSLHEQKQYFRTVKPKNWVLPINWIQPCTGGKEKGFFRVPRSGLTWFNIIWVGIFQYCFIRILFTFVALITQLIGRYCSESLSPLFGHVWVEVFDAMAVTIAMYCLIQFYVQLREDLAPNKPFLKICCIKLVIFFSFWQAFLISFLSSGKKPVITTGPRVSYVDVQVGIPSVLLCIEMTLFAVLHIFAFPWRVYDISKSDNPSDYYAGGALGYKALLDAFNVMDFIRAAARGFRWLFVGVRYREQDESYREHREPGTLSTGQKITGPYPLSPNTDHEDEFPKVGQENIELMDHNRVPKRQPTDDFGDHTALLSQPQRMPMSSSPETRPLYPTAGAPDRSDTSTPPAYVSASRQYRDPIRRTDTPPGGMETGVIGAGRTHVTPLSPLGPSSRTFNDFGQAPVDGRRRRNHEPPGHGGGYGQAF